MTATDLIARVNSWLYDECDSHGERHPLIRELRDNFAEVREALAAQNKINEVLRGALKGCLDQCVARHDAEGSGPHEEAEIQAARTALSLARTERIEAAPAGEAAPPPEREHDQDGGAAESDLIALGDLPLFWRGRAKTLRILDEKRTVADAAALETAAVYEECANELRAALADDRERLKAATIVARTALLLAEAERADG